MGRRKAKPTKTTSLRLSSELAAELSVVARAEGVPISDVVRVAIGKHIESRRADEEFQARLKEQMEKDREVLERLTD